jgi:hypothetical protein
MYEAALYSFNYKLWKVARSSSKIDYVKQDYATVRVILFNKQMIVKQ